MPAFPSRRFVLALAAAAVAGCGDSSGPPAVDTVAIVGAPASIQLGSSVTLSAQTKDAGGTVLTGRTVSWSTSSASIASVTPAGVVTAVGLGSVTITAESEGKTVSVTISVIPVPVAVVTVTLSAAQVTVGETVQASAITSDVAGRTLTGRTVTWSSSQPTIASVDPNTGLVTGIAPGGPVSIIGTSEGVAGSAQLVVVGVVSGTGTLQLTTGEVRTLTGTDRSSFCIGGAASSEYVLIPFNNSPTASSTASLQVTGSNTSAPSSPAMQSVDGRSPRLQVDIDRSAEHRFRIRERQDLAAAMRAPRTRMRSDIAASMITGIPANPAIGSVFPINTSITGNTCTGAKVLRDARVVSVNQNVIVLIDTQAPAGGYTDAEMADFGQTFQTLGYGIDTLNFGTPSDIDGNEKVAILFTHSVNSLSAAPGVIIGGLQASRDLFPVTTCPGSNEGEMFYMPVPDPASTINGNYTDKTSLARRVQGTLAHELQHLINAGRRIYVHDAQTLEEVWLNEGLSHIAEELVYFAVSGNTPQTNINLPRVQSSQAQLDAINTYQLQNLGRLRLYMGAPETNSPYAQNDNLETRGATWELLRFASDRKGGNERNTWFSLANTTQAGLTNFSTVFGSPIPIVRDWAITQFVDDTGIPVPPTFSYPSWNFRSLLPAINSGVFPLMTRTLTGPTLNLALAGGGAGYLRFRVTGGTTASVTAASSGQPVPESVDLILVRTQ